MTCTTHSQFYSTPKLDGLSALNAHVYQHSFSMHSHETYQVTLINQGVFKNQIGDQLIHAFENQITITHPQEVHATICDEHTPLNFFTLYIPASLIASRAKNKATGMTGFNSVIDDDFLVTAIRKVKQGIIQNKQWQESISWLIIDRLLQHHQSPIGYTTQQQGSIDLSQLKLNDKKFNLDDWAQQFNLNRFKFLRLFKSETGMTPNQYLIFKRIKQSQSLLIEGSDLTDAALTCGFYDLPHFHKHFKSITGVTPLVFQQAHQSP